MLVCAALHAQAPEAERIAYGSRQLKTACAVGLSERCRVQELPPALPLSAHGEYAALLDVFGVELLPSAAPPPA